MEGLKKRLRFGEFEDLILLREVLSLNPFENPNEWFVVQEHMFLITQKKFLIRTLKDHLERLIKLWLEKIKILKDKSGIEEPQTEKDNLCQNIYELTKSSKKEKRIKKLDATSQATSKKEGENARNKWASMTPNSQSIQYKENNEASNKIFVHDHSYYVDSSVDCEMTEANNVQEEILLEIEVDESASSEQLENKDNCSLLMNKSRSNLSACNEERPLGLGTPAKKAKFSMQSPSCTPARSSRISAPVRSRTRKVNAQRQGLAYLEKYDSQQLELKRKEIEIEERKVALQEEKLILEKEEKARKITFDERKIALEEYEIKKKLELEEKKINLEMEGKKMLRALIERQEKIINMLLNKECKCNF